MSTKEKAQIDEKYWEQYETGGFPSPETESDDSSFNILLVVLKEIKKALKDGLQKMTKRDRV